MLTVAAVHIVGQACARGTACAAVLVVPAAAALVRHPLYTAPWAPRAPGRLGVAGAAAAQSVEQDCAPARDRARSAIAARATLAMRQKRANATLA